MIQAQSVTTSIPEARLQELRRELKADIYELKHEIKADIRALSSDLRAETSRSITESVQWFLLILFQSVIGASIGLLLGASTIHR
jgi:hypothetical protein